MKTETPTNTNQQSDQKAATDKFKIKIARLTSLIEQIKRYSQPEINRLLDLEKIERLLSQPELADRDWPQECPEHQARFLYFLKVHISVYGNTLKQLEEKGL